MLAASRSDLSPAPPPPLERFFEQHHGQIFNAAFRVTGSAQDAEDVLQTVFLRLLGRGEDVDLAPSPGAYLHRAAVNASLDLLRARTRTQQIPLDELKVDLPDDAAPDPERLQRDRENRGRLRRALLELSPKSAEIFCLRFFEGVENREIARTLGLSQTAVNVTLHRARHQIKKAFSRA